LPAILIGRLAVDDLQTGNGLGKRLLMDALLRSYTVSRVVASYAVVVDYIDLEAKQFYQKFGFIELLDTNRLFLPMATIKESIVSINF
jgi:predicted GNAT family N-acyltransferase